MQEFKYNRTDHKTYLVLGTNCYMLWQEGAILTEFIRKSVSYVQHVLQVPVALSSIIK